jgi:hypothetical protein
MKTRALCFVFDDDKYLPAIEYMFEQNNYDVIGVTAMKDCEAKRRYSAII